MADSQRARETSNPSRPVRTKPAHKGKLHFFCFLGAAIWCLPAHAQTVAPELPPPPSGYSFQTPLSAPTPLSPPGQAWPTVQSAVPALWTPRGAVVAPGPPTTPPFLVSGAIDVAQGYDTNPSQASTNVKGDAFSRGQVDLGLHYETLRLKVDAHSSTSGYYFYSQHDLNQLNENLNFVANSELIPEHLFLNLNATAAPVALSRVGQLSTIPGFIPSSNSQQSYGYFANPVYRTHFGDYVSSETSFSYSQLFFLQPSSASTDPTFPVTPLQNTTSSTVSQRFSSGPYFGRLKWDLNAAYSTMDQTGQSEQETLVIPSAAYAINRVFSILGTAGYDQITTSAPLTQNLTPLVALGGFRVSFGPRFALAAEAGVSHGFPTYLGSLNWDVTATFKVVGSLTDSISTSQGAILNNLSTLAVSSEGVFSDTQSYYWQTQQQALNPQFATVSPAAIGGLSLTNGLTRDRQANLSFIHADERNTYSLSLFGDLQDLLSSPTLTSPSNTLPAQSSSSTYGARVSVTRNLRRNLTGTGSVSYSLANEYGGSDRILTLGAGLNYSLSPKTDAYLSAQYLQRESMGQIFFGGNISDATVMVGMRHKL